jgi:hypothetical protein
VLLIEAFKFVPNAIACKVSVIIPVTASKEAQLVRHAKALHRSPMMATWKAGPPRKLVKVDEPRC